MAPGHEHTLPSEGQLKDFCNLGYSIGCPQLPEQRETDANRFFVSETRTELIVVFCSERQHLPREHAILRFDPVHRAWTERYRDPCVQRQAECAVNSFLHKREVCSSKKDEPTGRSEIKEELTGRLEIDERSESSVLAPSPVDL